MNRQQSLCALLLGGILLSAAVLFTPAYNWDMVAYIAAAHALTESDMHKVHARTYDDIKRHIPAPVYASLTGQRGETSTRWRSRMAADPHALAQLLPAFQVKPAYPLLMYGLHTLGMDLFEAGVAIPKVAWWLTGLLLYCWLCIYLRPWAACLCTALVMLSPAAVVLARLFSPDALSTLVTLAVLYLLTERHAMGRTALLLAILSIFTRHSNLLLLFLVAGVLAWRSPGLRPAALACCAGGAVVYLTMKHAYDNFGWTVFFYHSAVERLITPRGFESPLILPDYMRLYLTHVRTDTTLATLWKWLLLGLPTLYGRLRIGGRHDPWAHTILICLTLIAVLWLALPSPSIGNAAMDSAASRLYVPTYFAILVCVAATLGRGTVLGLRVPSVQTNGA